jgi:EAL domain-containing protein (putative c-di-GMP-specific phosphodiesterase class I)/ActR/RegA family two-component response regulator
MEQTTRPRKILVVDDEPFVLKVLVRQLTALGYEDILSYEHAQDALSVLETQDHQIDVVFTDLQMPGMDGVEFLRQLVQRGYDGQVVLVSGEDTRVLKSAEKLAYSRGLHVLGSLAKPATREQLQQRLHCVKPPVSASEICGAYLPEELRAAIAAGEVVTCFQPQVAFATGELTGVEAMIAWRHPRDGLIPADRLLANERFYGVLNDLTRTTLPSTLEQAARWQGLGDDFRVAVNLSMEDLAALDFPDFIVDAAKHAGFPLSRIVLEINTSHMTRDGLISLDVLTRLRLKRISLLLDDFGTGQASLAHLRDVPFDELKLDGGFVHGASRNASLGAIVKASLLLARQLNMRTIAQGIDDLDDWKVLRDLSCDVAQGDFVGAPMPGDALADWARTWAARYASLTH